MIAKVSKALTIAGSDSGGGAGIQADLKTFQELGVYGMSVITAVTAQNTLGVQGVLAMPVDIIIQQLDSIGTDLEPQGLKTGMLFSKEIIEAVANQIIKYGWTNLVVDPVMIAKGGTALLREDAVEAMRKVLIPLAEVVTPNILEAEVLAGFGIETLEDRKEAAKQIYKLGAKHVLVKGGHGKESEEAIDILYDGKIFTKFTATRILTKDTHGTGCTFAAAIASELAKGSTMQNAIQTAKSFIQSAIAYPLGLGHGHGPTNHWAYNRMNERTKV
jgi:hydroxymethylpyrimidine/phosphomethylpyrimidine kinase